MDISIIKGKIKLKGKQTSCEVNSNVVITRPDGSTFEIAGQGEYEAGGITVVATSRGYVIEIESLRVCVLDPKNSNKLEAAEIEELGSVDITVCDSQDLAKQTDPWVIVTTGGEGTPKYSVTKDKLPSDLQVVVLTSK
jgi:hypothetical protein